MANYIKEIKENRLNLKPKNYKREIVAVFHYFLALFYPSIYNTFNLTDEELIEEITKILNKEIKKEDVSIIIDRIPDLIIALNKDIKAIYQGDPAATSYEEIVITYPGFYAIMAYRIAHEFYKLNYFVIARIISENAHSKTGIDIHPGATIGDSFCIDHGTGIVIGETTIIGNNVRIYQGVTLGTRSFLKDEDGQLKRNYKRHPTIGNNVIIYANASILGGDTCVGDNSVIGSNVWLDTSIEANSNLKNTSGGI